MELYRTAGFDPERVRTTQTYEAIERTSGNYHQSQYYLQTVTKTAVVSHIVSNHFWFILETNRTLKDGARAYTAGFLWTNTNPNWTWSGIGGMGGSSRRKMRCRVDVPPGTQLVVDRSPVYPNTKCQFDEDRTSVFPDVLLPPGEFEIVSVKRYQTEGGEAADSDSDEDGDDLADRDVTRVSAVEGRPQRTVLDDEEYAQWMLMEATEFIDVRLKVLRTMVFPEL